MKKVRLICIILLLITSLTCAQPPQSNTIDAQIYRELEKADEYIGANSDSALIFLKKAKDR